MSKLNFRQASICCKRVLEAAELASANESILAFITFGELLIVFSTEVNLLYYLYLKALRYFFLHLIKKTFAKIFFEN